MRGYDLTGEKFALLTATKIALVQNGQRKEKGHGSVNASVATGVMSLLLI